MNINCQNSAYVGRTNLSQDTTIHKTLQAEIDTLTLNLDTLQTNYDMTSNLMDTDIAPITWLINNEIEYFTPPLPDRTHTYIYNSNILGEIRFWVKDTSNYPPVIPFGVPDYGVKIDVDGKLKLYYTYDPAINLTWGNGWIDPAVMIIGAVADAINQGISIGALETQVLNNFTILNAQLGAVQIAIDAILLEIEARIAEINDPSDEMISLLNEDIKDRLNQGLKFCEDGLTPNTTQSALSSLYDNVKNFATSYKLSYIADIGQNIKSLISLNPAASFYLGVGGAAFAIAYGILQNAQFDFLIKRDMENAIKKIQI